MTDHAWCAPIILWEHIWGPVGTAPLCSCGHQIHPVLSLQFPILKEIHSPLRTVKRYSQMIFILVRKNWNQRSSIQNHVSNFQLYWIRNCMKFGQVDPQFHTDKFWLPYCQLVHMLWHELCSVFSLSSSKLQVISGCKTFQLILWSASSRQIPSLFLMAEAGFRHLAWCKRKMTGKPFWNRQGLCRHPNLTKGSIVTYMSCKGCQSQTVAKG